MAGGSATAPCPQPGRVFQSPPGAHGSPTHRVGKGAGIDFWEPGRQPQRLPVRRGTTKRRQGNGTVNRIIWIVGLVVIILFILGFFGLR
jgi:hypothetical protein